VCVFVSFSLSFFFCSEFCGWQGRMKKAFAATLRLFFQTQGLFWRFGSKKESFADGFTTSTG